MMRYALLLALVFSASSAFAETAGEAAAGPCHKIGDPGRVRTVDQILDDGTIVLDGKERITLLGVQIPEGQSGGEKSFACRDEAVRYMRARIANTGVLIYREEGVERDEAFRMPAYVQSQSGQFFNREMVRYGFVRVFPRRPDNKPIACADELVGYERTARAKGTGLWNTDCLK